MLEIERLLRFRAVVLEVGLPRQKVYLLAGQSFRTGDVNELLLSLN